MLATASVAIAETAYIGQLGIAPLAGFALAFPMVMLMQMMSAGAMGGGVSSAISRSLGAGNVARAEALARHALVIAALAGVAFTAIFVGLGPIIYASLGGRSAVLAEAVTYSNMVFLGAIFVWSTNTLASVLRGTGNMRVPSAVLLAVAALQVALGAGLGLGLAGLPRLGIAGVGLAQAIAFAVGTAAFAWHLASGRARVRLRAVGSFHREMFRDILKVGAVACISPLQSVATVLVMTRLVSSFGTEALAGYGIGARLEFLIVPITFAIGVASVPMVGMAIGSGDVERARRVAWTAGGSAGLLVGGIGLVVAAAPELWSRLFTDNADALASARTYFRSAGPAYGFLGLALALYFASMGSGRILGPVIAQTVRLCVIAVGGWWLALQNAAASSLFLLVGVSLLAYGVAAALSVLLVSWEPRVARQSN
ncbi:MAG: MATE family efflux transporter [Hyphomicrobiaceae bacterium]|nr:MATE family efflux transporter [Hyphomicrobiaceae bacterium]